MNNSCNFIIENGYNTSYIDSLLVALFYKSSYIDKLLQEHPQNETFYYLQEIIQTNFVNVIKRNYVVKEPREGKERQFITYRLKDGNISSAMTTEITGTEKGKLYPTDIGIIVNDFLQQYFSDIMDFNFTARVEEEFDEIANGKLKWKDMLKEFYTPFHKDVIKTGEESERASGEKVLGKDPKSGREVLVRVGRFGPMAQIGRQDDKEKPKYASMRKGQMIDTITLEEALDLFKLPRAIGSHDGKEIIISIGRFGPYIKYGEEYIPLAKTEDPYTVTLERVVEIITGPRLPRKVGTYEGQDIIAAKGFFGNYLRFGNTNASLNKNYDPFTISLEDAIVIVKAKAEKDAAKHIKSWEGERRVKVVLNRWGKPSIQSGKKYFNIPKDKDPLELELEECLQIAGFKKAKKGKAEPKAKADVKNEAEEKKIPIKKAASKMPVVKKHSPQKPKLRIIKAKKKFYGTRRGKK